MSVILLAVKMVGWMNFTCCHRPARAPVRGPAKVLSDSHPKAAAYHVKVYKNKTDCATIREVLLAWVQIIPVIEACIMTVKWMTMQAATCALVSHGS